MVDLTLDIQVFMSGSGTGDPAHKSDSRRLMESMRDAEQAFLVVDDHGYLERQYDQRSKQGFGKQWMIQMLSKRAVIRVSRRRLPSGTRAALDEQGFKGEDRNWIARTAAASRSRILVANEDHFHASKVKKILKKDMGITVLSASEAAMRIAESAVQT